MQETPDMEFPAGASEILEEYKKPEIQKSGDRSAVLFGCCSQCDFLLYAKRNRRKNRIMSR